MTERRIFRRIRGMDTADGAGVKLKRIIGQPALDMLDPFLLLDEFRSDSADDYIAGFPEHLHRGFETEHRRCSPATCSTATTTATAAIWAPAASSG